MCHFLTWCRLFCSHLSAAPYPATQLTTVYSYLFSCNFPFVFYLFTFKWRIICTSLASGISWATSPRITPASCLLVRHIWSILSFLLLKRKVWHPTVELFCLWSSNKSVNMGGLCCHVEGGLDTGAVGAFRGKSGNNGKRVFLKTRSIWFWFLILILRGSPTKTLKVKTQ